MTEEEITTLAREYAEEMAKGPEFEELSDGMKENVLALNTVYVAEVIHWLCERFCLVEKYRVQRVAKVLTEQCKYANDTGFYKFDLSCCTFIIRQFFPEIAKVNEEK